MADHTQFYAAKKEAGLKIDPATAETWWCWGQVLDPYGLGDLSEKYECIGRNYFARARGSDEWVVFGDLPISTREALWRRGEEAEEEVAF
jgi:hypothetical protein